jgi:hypothetical protein
MICKKWIRSYGLTREDVGTATYYDRRIYMVVRVIPEQHLAFVRNPHWWERFMMWLTGMYI